VSLERDGYDGPITFCCDECGEVEETHCAVWSGALAKIKSYGWVARKVGEDWHHYCKDCRPR
jgi:Fe2+ or Zn2+ uptake regulation protein